RVFHVTGVQTCALPIYRGVAGIDRIGQELEDLVVLMQHRVLVDREVVVEVQRRTDGQVSGGDVRGLLGGQQSHQVGIVILGGGRSEERRVGKEWRSGGA